MPVTIYGRTFHIVGCDKVARDHFASHGISVAQDEPYPNGDIEARLQVGPQYLLESTGTDVSLFPPKESARAAALRKPDPDDPLSALRVR